MCTALKIDTFFSQIHCSAGMSKGIGLTMEEVSEKCWSFEAPAYVAVSFFLCLSPNFLLPINCEKGFQFCCLCTYGRFNEHLGKKGISGHINVDYKNEVLSVEVSYFHRISFSCCLSICIQICFQTNVTNQHIMTFNVADNASRCVS